LAIRYPSDFSAVDRSQIERALEAALPPSRFGQFDGLSRASVMPRRYASEAAAIRAVVAVCEAVACTLTSPRPMAAVDRQTAATDLRDQIIAWAYAWLPWPRTRTLSAFAGTAREELETRLFWVLFRRAAADCDVGTARPPIDRLASRCRGPRVEPLREEPEHTGRVSIQARDLRRLGD